MDWLVFLLLVCAVPLQLWLVDNTSPLNDMSVKGWHGGRGYIAAVRELFEYTSEVNSNTKKGGKRPLKSEPAPEPIELARDTMFAGSSLPRRQRTGISYRIGQVIRHRKHGYRGVIIGWDAQARAPEAWFKRMGVSASARKQPFYSVLVDVRDRPGDQTTYVWQGNIEVVTEEDVGAEDMEIINSKVDEHFKTYLDGGSKYQAKDWLQRRYPKD